MRSGTMSAGRSSTDLRRSTRPLGQAQGLEGCCNQRFEAHNVTNLAQKNRSSSESMMGEVAESAQEGLAFVSLSQCSSTPTGYPSVRGIAGNLGFCSIVWR
jgi:hypothetical protein